MHYHLRHAGKHNNYKAKLVAILIRLYFIKTEKLGSTLFTLDANNHTAIKSFTLDLIHLGQTIIPSIIHMASKICEKHYSQWYLLVIYWIAGHSGIVGNEKADKKAKHVAKGTTSNKKLLSSLLYYKLTINSITLKISYNAKMNEN